MRYFVFALTLCSLLFFACKDEPTLNLYGQVLDSISGNPVEGALISDGSYAPKLGAGDLSDELGNFSYFTYPEEHNVIISKQGYKDYKLTIGLNSGARKEKLHILLIPVP